MPFLELIFNGDGSGISSLSKGSQNPVVEYIRNFLADRIQNSNGDLEGKMRLLLFICSLIIVSILLKNLFLYLAIKILNPLKNRIINNLRTELYDKILILPIGYFTEKRKGDLISRITNDISEVEGSVVGAIEGWIRDPLTIIINFAVLFYLSPQLTFFLLFFIPAIALIIGRVNRSMKRQSNEIANKYADIVFALDETLGGLRVIKAFNVENILRSRFLRINDEMFRVKNKINNRRDLASPLSEFMEAMVLWGILYFGG